MRKSDILENFQEYIVTHYTSESTLKTYSYVAEKFIYDKHPTDLYNLTKNYIRTYLISVKGESSYSKHNQYLSVIKIIYNSVLRQKYKVRGFKPIRVERKLKNLPSHAYLKQTLQSIPNTKHKAMLSILIGTGIRKSELFNIRILDVDSNRNCILINKGKGGKSRFVSLNKHILSDLRTYYKQYRPKYYLFEGQYGCKYTASSLDKIVKKYFGKEYHPHLFRHYYISYMINNNIHPNRLMNSTGHRSTKSVTWYYQYSENAIEHSINPLNEIYESRN